MKKVSRKFGIVIAVGIVAGLMFATPAGATVSKSEVTPYNATIVESNPKRVEFINSVANAARVYVPAALKVATQFLLQNVGLVNAAGGSHPKISAALSDVELD
jgi:hypothetical protein